MAVHDWTRVEAGIFHDFHHAWIEEIKRALNRGLLPPDHYALAEQIAGSFGPDVLTLEGPARPLAGPPNEMNGAVALAEVQPKVSFRAKTEADIYAAKANRVVVRHVTHHRVFAVIEIVSPGNKSTRPALRAFAEKAAELLRGGVHLMIVDLFPPTPRDPQGIHRVIWDELDVCDFTPPPDRLLTAASYIGGATQEAFVEPIALQGSLPAMPLFLTPEVYVSVPLETTYQAAWEAVPLIWQRELRFGDA